MNDAAPRKMLTAEERVAKLEAELAAAKAKADAKKQKQIDALVERRDTLVAQVAERNTKLIAINLELDELGYVAEPAKDSEESDASVTDISARTGS